jgi:hypothetical protein
MLRFRFSLRQVLIAVVLDAVLLLIARYAVRTRTGTAVALTVCATAVVLAAAHALFYAWLRVIGRLSADDAAPMSTPAKFDRVELSDDEVKPNGTSRLDGSGNSMHCDLDVSKSAGRFPWPADARPGAPGLDDPVRLICCSMRRPLAFRSTQVRMGTY